MGTGCARRRFFELHQIECTQLAGRVDHGMFPTGGLPPVQHSPLDDALGAFAELAAIPELTAATSTLTSHHLSRTVRLVRTCAARNEPARPR